MIEAVNSTIANATTVRGVVGQVDSASIASVSAVLPASGSDAVPSAPRVPFVSPYIAVDLNYNTPVLQIRDAQTGDVKQQFPTEARLTQIATTQAQLCGGTQEAVIVTTPAVTSSSSVSSSVSVASVAQMAVQTVNITTVQDVTVTPASNNTASSTPQLAVAALSTAAQSSTTSAVADSTMGSSGVTVYA